MKLALLGDIHSNYRALEQCLGYCEQERIDGYVFLGDYISDCPYPGRTLEMIRKILDKYPSWIIRGNREGYQINHQENEDDHWEFNSSTGSLLYTYENLTSDDLKQFREWDVCQVISIEGYPDITICHGSPCSDRELLHIGSELAKKRLIETETQLLICAHTHIQGRYDYSGKTLINPGSVGVAVGVEGKAQFAILHGEEKSWRPEFLTLGYDIKLFLKEFDESDLPKKSKTFAKLIQYELLTGENILIEVILQAEERMKEALGNIPYDNIPDEFWESAYQQVVEERGSMQQSVAGEECM
jgi:putative phosphoesterase